MRQRTLIALPLALAASIALSACVGGTTSASESSEGLPADIAASGKLKVGLSANLPPMEFKDESGKYVGADVDLQQELGKALGVDIEIVESPFDQLINSAQTGRVDLVMSGMSDTAERQKTADFVDYFKSEGRLFTTGKRAKDFTAADDICGKKIAVSGKTDYYAQVEALGKTECTDKGKPAIELLSTDSGTAARLQIDQGRADLAAQSAENLAYFEQTDPGKYKNVLDPLPSKPLGILVKKGNDQLSNAVLKALQIMHEDGTYDDVLKKWDIDYGAMEPTINGATS
ncbi:ABC transporter substrate-binding protein [Arthrobacter sp.]|uniref:ABC transporter substrate-binding protein n=1 Tax=Arthrobacter sp. TaxID=1667 RepID=UPI003A93C724